MSLTDTRPEPGSPGGPGVPGAGDDGDADIRVGTPRRVTALVVAAIGLAAACVLSLMIGNQALSPLTVVRALWSDDDPGARDIVRGLRMDRTIIGVAVGLALGAAGALMQALTRNPLADPGLLGVNAGAAAAVVTGIAFLDITDPHAQIWFAFAGAAAASVAVYVLGSGGRSSTTPLRLALAGAALSAVLVAYINGIALSSQPAFDKMRFWMVGSLVGQELSVLLDALPFLVIGMVAALVITPALTAMAMGEDTGLAAKLGADTTCNEELNQAKETYAEGLKKVGESAGELKVLVASAAEDSLYVVNPTDLPETQTFEQAGVDIIEAPNPDTGQVFTQLSWEKASEFADADVILLDGRNTEDVKNKLDSIDTWANLPAVKAGQVYTWYAGAPYSYQSYTQILDELATDLAKSEDLG